MTDMNPSLIQMQHRRARARRLSQATAARRRLRTAERAQRLPARRGGRAWINGAQTAEADPALVHLAELYD